MRRRYSKVRPDTNTNFASHLVDAGASLGGDVTKSAIFDVLQVWDFRELIEHYHEKAEKNGTDYGCANCLGIEVLRSCLLARQAAAAAEPALLQLADLNTLANAYPNIAAAAFGASPVAWYRTGLMHQGARYSLMKSASYSALKKVKYKPLIDAFEAQEKIGGADDQTAADSAKAYGKRFLAVTKSSANAHAVLSRAELEACVRYGLCEFLVAALSTVSLRDEKVVRQQALKLALGDQDAAALDSYVETAWANKSRQVAADAPSGGVYAGYLEFTFAMDLLDWQVKFLAKVVGEAALDGAKRRAVMAAGCALVRRKLIEASKRARHAAPDIDDFLANVAPFLSATSVEANINVAVVNAKDIPGELGKGVGQGRAASGRQVINEIGLAWKTEESVEFGHQCGICENAQGDGSLIRRAVDYYSDKGALDENPIVGITYAGLALTDSTTDTIWDLSSAVVCQAIDVLMTSAHKALATIRGEPNKDFLLSLLYHCNNTPWLFVAYFQTMFLEMAYSDPDATRRRLVKILTHTPRG
ncbi:MAG TPA: hypothetical protein VMG12_20465 [Polyangiaceae bacterium]|nr:hypothetical protein [Polyangiaceae bacterium]